MGYAHIQVSPTGGTIGAEVAGVDLAKPLADAVRDEVERAFHEHLVLCFRGQRLSPQSLLTLTEALGGAGETPYLGGLPGFADVVPVVKEADERSPVTFGASWHTDFTFQRSPPSRTILYAVDVPQAGGDTLFCNLYRAWETLSPGMQQMLEGLTAVHSSVRSYGPGATLREHLEHMEITNEAGMPREQEHPVVRTHPVTGRKALWVNPVYVIRFKDMSEAESAPLLNFLNGHAVQPSFACRVRWMPGSLTMWDNRCTQHCATADYAGQRREMWRTTVAGEVPV